MNVQKNFKETFLNQLKNSNIHVKEFCSTHTVKRMCRKSTHLCKNNTQLKLRNRPIVYCVILHTINV